MNPRICIACGEHMPEVGNALARNPNLCAACSSMADEIEDSEAYEPVLLQQEPVPVAEQPWETRKAA
jgi:hypothetical protein